MTILEEVVKTIKTTNDILSEISWQDENWGKGGEEYEPIMERVQFIQRHLDRIKQTDTSDEEALVELRIIAGIVFSVLRRYSNKTI